MPKEYIEREAIIKHLDNLYDHMNALGASFYQGFQVARHNVNDFPAADVVEVVRCEDCLYSTERYGHIECIHGVSCRNTWNKPDFFCPYGDRKEGADNG